MDSEIGIEKLKKEEEELFHFIYVDGSHQYEKVLNDLMFSKDLLNLEFGCFQLNDCCISANSVKQNIGVLEAVNKFCYLANFVPVLAVNRDFTDVLLTPAQSIMKNYIEKVFELSDVSCVEVPNALFPNLKVKFGKRPMISFA